LKASKKILGAREIGPEGSGRIPGLPKKISGLSGGISGASEIPPEASRILRRAAENDPGASTKILGPSKKISGAPEILFGPC
jgi:hypothetical protein